MGQEKRGIGATLGTGFLTIKQKLEAHPMVGVVRSVFKVRNQKKQFTGTGSVFQYKLLKDWEGALERGRKKADEYNKMLRPRLGEIKDLWKQVKGDLNDKRNWWI